MQPVGRVRVGHFAHEVPAKDFHQIRCHVGHGYNAGAEEVNECGERWAGFEVYGADC